MSLETKPDKKISENLNQSIRLGISYSVKRSDVIRWKQGYITPPPPYFFLWNAVTSLGENKVI